MKVSGLNDIDVVRQYLNRVGAEPRSMMVAVVKEKRGLYWKDMAVIRFDKSGEVNCDNPEYCPTEGEQNAIKAAFKEAEWPVLQPLDRLINTPAMISEAPDKDVFLFRDEQNKIVMVQVRVEREGDKNYVPWTYWDDGKWRICEPDGPLPIYNAHLLKDASTVFIHEGAKAARRVQWMVDGETAEARQALAQHPWGVELAGAVHLGWIGGALSPYRTDWSALKRNGVRRAYIVADNDAPGLEAIPAISRQIRIPAFSIEFTDQWPTSFDLHDTFPESLFRTADGVPIYQGPTFRDCMHPATWATDTIPNPSGKGRPVAVLRDSFKGQWSYIEEIDMYVCNEMPQILRSETVLNKMLAKYSDVSETARLIAKAAQGRTTRLCYMPGEDGNRVTYRGSSAINLHIKPQIREIAGDPTPWLEFIDYLFVNKDERDQVLRWCATLIARPEIRINYGLLLISEAQGTGKTTLGAAVLAPLVGYDNVSFPGEKDVTSDFNGWIASKRLAIVNEIYSGSSWKAYNMLKSVITDMDVQVNDKYVKPYTIQNWCHVVACSNSMRALKMEQDDRRWLYPEVTEVPWPPAKFKAFREWLNAGGLGIVLHWARGFGNYVHTNEIAPMTSRKQEMIEGSRSEAQSEAAAIATVACERSEPITLVMKEVVTHIKNHADGRVFDSDYELRRAMTDAGLKVHNKRVKMSGRMQYLLLNPAALDLVQRAEESARNDEAKKHIVKPSEIMEAEI